MLSRSKYISPYCEKYQSKTNATWRKRIGMDMTYTHATNINSRRQTMEIFYKKIDAMSSMEGWRSQETIACCKTSGKNKVKSKRAYTICRQFS